MHQQQIEIEELSTLYRATNKYYSDFKRQNYEVEVSGAVEPDGRISIKPNHCGNTFEFCHSDPDRVIAVAQMMISLAQMAKDDAPGTLDVNANV